MDVKTKAEQSATTRAALIGAARTLFAQRGYSGVPAEEIVRAAGVTRGALYHHFGGKEDLFRAVFEAVEGELTKRIASEAMTGADPFAAMRAGAQAFLDSCLDPEVQRITLLDAPAVLGWQQWRELGQRYGLGLIRASLEAAMDAGQIARQPVTPLAHLHMGALDEAALLIAQADDVPAARREIGAVVDGFLASFRLPDSPAT